MNNPSFLLNLPSEIAVEIFSRLPIRTIVLCKCVCKELLEILSSPEFAKSHFSRSTPAPGIIFHLTQMNETMCSVVEVEDNLKLQRHDLRYKLMMKFNPTEFIDSPDTSIMLHNSVNGLLFLHDYSNLHDALYISNPITREYIAIPNPDVNAYYLDSPTYGFGVSALSGHYKVISISYEPSIYGGEGHSLKNRKVKCLVYTLGSGSWRSIEHGELYSYCYNGAFLNGNVHWLVNNLKGSPLISCLDLETELFQPLPPPPLPNSLTWDTSMTLAVSEDCLWFFEYAEYRNIVVWVMKEYGVKESWTQQCVVENYLPIESKSFACILPVKAFKDGDILFLQEDLYMFYYRSKTGTSTEVNWFERKIYDKFEAISYTSSLLALKSFAMEKVVSF